MSLALIDRRLTRLFVIFAVGVMFFGVANAGPPFRTDDPEPVESGHFEVNLLSTGTKIDSGVFGVLPGLEMNYGALPELQLHAIIPADYAAANSLRTKFGLGDMEFGAKYRFLKPGEEDWYPPNCHFSTDRGAGR